MEHGDNHGEGERERERESATGRTDGVRGPTVEDGGGATTRDLSDTDDKFHDDHDQRICYERTRAVGRH